MKRMSVAKPGKVITVVDGQFKIIFPFNYDTLHIIKSIPNREFHSEGKPKYWTCPINEKTTLLLQNAGFFIYQPTTKSFQKIIKQEKVKPIEVSGLKKKLRLFQEVGVATIYKKNGRGLIADEMGLGKTIQAISVAQVYRKITKITPIIIVCPSIAKLMWYEEIRKWLKKPFKMRILEGLTPDPLQLDREIIIINYRILPNLYEKWKDADGKIHQKEKPYTGWVDYLCDIKPKMIITDECHYYKTDTASRTKAIKKLAIGVPSFIALSGTPIEKSPVDIFNAANIIDPKEWPNKWRFQQRYCNPVHNGFGWSFNGSSNEKELHQRLVNSIMIRRTKKQVAKELPKKVWSIVPFKLDNRNTYIKAEDNFIDFVRKTRGKKAAKRASNAESLVRVDALKQLAARGKLVGIIEWITNFLESGEKLVVFALHTFMLDELMKIFGEIAVRVDGTVSEKKKFKNVKKFQRDPNTLLFLGHMKAAGVVITLTAASNVAIIEYPHVPGVMEQAVDRCHRIGQRKSVNIYSLMAINTIEERQANLLSDRSKMIGSIIDGDLTKKQEKSLLSELMDSYL